MSEWIKDAPGQSQGYCPYPDCRKVFTFPLGYKAPEILQCPYCKRSYVMLDAPLVQSREAK